VEGRRSGLIATCAIWKQNANHIRLFYANQGLVSAPAIGNGPGRRTLGIVSSNLTGGAPDGIGFIRSFQYTGRKAIFVRFLKMDNVYPESSSIGRPRLSSLFPYGLPRSLVFRSRKSFITL